jgi:D-alanine-D-alanine ligase
VLRRGGFVPVVIAVEKEEDHQPSEKLDAELAVADALVTLGYDTEVVEVAIDLTALTDIVARRPPLVVFNLVDAILSDGRFAPLVPAKLDGMGIPYTGCSTRAMFAAISKLGIKLALTHAGLPTPEWSVTGKDLSCDRAIVKAVWEHGSLGIDESSVVLVEDVPQTIALRDAYHRTEHFAEAYIDGREFQVFMLECADGVQVMPVTEVKWYNGLARIFSYDAKWTPTSLAYARQKAHFGLERDDINLAVTLRDYAETVWSLFGFNGYARVDFRVDDDGNPFIIDVNPNPYLSLDAEDVAAAAQAGISYQELIGTIVESALNG